MAISHSNHLFVPVVFVFLLLSPLVQTEDSNGEHQTLYINPLFIYMYITIKIIYICIYTYNFLFYLIVI